MKATLWKRRRGLRPVVFGALLTAVVVMSATSEAQQGNQKWEVLNNKATGNFIVALAQDLQGNIWVGTEDKGVFRYDPKADQWTQFNSKNGLGDDNAYAIACDKLGRVWVGTLNKGVSVYNGKEWKTYGVLDGPIGERIFAISTCPTDGDVWMATSAGLTRYSLKNDAWSYYTRSDGLPEDQANAITFDAQGNIYVGTQCHGIAMAKASDGYNKWTTNPGMAQIPLAPAGAGLPAATINSVCVTRNGTVYAATTTGLAWSKDKGASWSYLRGQNYGAKVKGRPGGAPKGWTEAGKEVMADLLPEDYVTVVREDDSGLLWLGFRQLGYAALDPKTHRRLFQGNKKGEGLPDDYIFTLLPADDYRHWVGTYNGGLGRAKQPLKGNEKKAKKDDASTIASPPPTFPLAAMPSSAAELTQMAAELKRRISILKPAVSQRAAVELADDWQTQGNWLGRHGRYCALLGAIHSPESVAYPSHLFRFRDQIGPHCRAGDSIRYWIHWLYSDDKRVLEMPPDYLNGRIAQKLTTERKRRRQAEWDDHNSITELAFFPSAWSLP